MGLALSVPSIDISRLVDWTETPNGSRYRVGSGSGRAGRCGRAIGVIALRHAGGYEVVMEMDDGRVESFAPIQLFPEAA